MVRPAKTYRASRIIPGFETKWMAAKTNDHRLVEYCVHQDLSISELVSLEKKKDIMIVLAMKFTYAYASMLIYTTLIKNRKIHPKRIA